jgi:hypothetical protein
MTSACKRVMKIYESVARKREKDGEPDYDGAAKSKDLAKRFAAILNKKFPEGPKLIILDDTEKTVRTGLGLASA